MARVDDYWNARQLAVEDLSREPLAEILARSGFATLDDHTLRVPFLDRLYRVDYPSFAFVDHGDTNAEVPVQEQVLILHYLAGRETNAPQTDEWVSYREIPGASFYFSAFVSRAINPLKAVFGQSPEKMAGPASALGGERIEDGDVGFAFRVFPKVPVRLILWAGDDEFPPEAGIVFDRRVGSRLSPEDIAWMTGMLVYRLIARSRDTA